MKTTRFLNMMAASLVGVAFMSCSSQDDVLTPAGQTYTMSVTAQKGGDETRALNLDGNTLNATWTEGDVVKVYNSASTELGELTAQTAGKSTTLSGTLTTLPENGATLTLKYLSPSYSQQDGTLTGADNSIDKVCDYATATVTATVSGTNVTTGAAEFQNQQAVVKFTLEDKANTSTKLSPTALTINDGTSDIVTLTSIPGATYTSNGEGVLYVAIPGFSDQTVTLTATVGTDTYTCTTSEAKTLENGKYYGVTAQMAKQAAAPEGAISGQFTVNSNGDKVYFSKGNLQLSAANTWKFADSQWSCFGNSQSDNHRDLFGWGTGNNPNQTSTNNSNYSSFTDWGTAAASSIGSGWRTLTGGDGGEWEYLFGTNPYYKRTTTSGLYFAKATVNGVPGVILLPDDWSTSNYTLSSTNSTDAAFDTNTISESDWSSKLESHGCVFLPAAGYRDLGTMVKDVGDYGGYWSSTAIGSGEAHDVYFDSGNVGPAYTWDRYYGFSVRLVKDVAAPAPAVPAGALNGEFSVSATKKVNFSKGNLKYNGSTWSFFDNQYDYFTTHDGTNWDRFGWSTSATTYGMNTSKTSSDYSGAFVDWGSNSDLQTALGTGWFTLSSAEWEYLFNTRSASTVGTTANARYAKARVNNVWGVILFPDTYTHPGDVTAPKGVNVTGDTGWNGNNYSSADWTKMESAGCVFLPAAGYRDGSSVYYAGTGGDYWSTTPYNEEVAYDMRFSSNVVNPANLASRRSGFSVRLVREVE